MSRSLEQHLRDELSLPEGSPLSIRLLEAAPAASAPPVAHALQLREPPPSSLARGLDPAAVTAILEGTLPFGLGRFDAAPDVFVILPTELHRVRQAERAEVLPGEGGAALVALDSQRGPIRIELTAGRALVLDHGAVYELSYADPSSSVSEVVKGCGALWSAEPWLWERLVALEQVADDTASLAAAGALLRLWRPVGVEARAEARRLLHSGRLPPPLAAAQAWLRALPPERLSATSRSAAREADRLIEALARGIEACLRAEVGATAAVRALVLDREGLAAQLTALRVAGVEGAEGCAAGLDRAALSALEALNLAIPAWTEAERALLRAAAAHDPAAWWPTLAEG